VPGSCCSVNEADFSCGGRLFQHDGPVAGHGDATWTVAGSPGDGGGDYEQLNYSDVRTLVVDGWAVTFVTARRGLGRGRSPPRPLLVVRNVTVHPSV